ncbi:MAG TPA: hypothetical protein VFE10_15070 [Phenylobacterium sp.]|jgi:Ca2+-binding RTX toxin-like protein|nr:hypothetical protein [Phenylobacterium sp.]
MTQANADAFNNATDTIIFRTGSASQARVLYNPLSFGEAPSVTPSLGGNSVTFANDGAQVRGLPSVGLFTDGSRLYIGSTGDDTVTGTAGADGLFGGAGDDSMGGGVGGDDLLQGNQGHDTLVASAGGLNTIFGGQGDDSIDMPAAGKSPTATNFAQGNLGNDTITAAGSTGVTTLIVGNGGADVLGAGAATTPSSSPQRTRRSAPG